MAEQIDGKWLKGLVFRTSERKQPKGEAARHVPVERKLRPSDVLAWEDQGETIVIVTADGSKYSVDKTAAEKDKA